MISHDKILLLRELGFALMGEKEEVNFCHPESDLSASRFSIFSFYPSD